MTPAKIYRRINGTWGSSCDGCQDTGHHILKIGDRFTAYSVHDIERHVCTYATRQEAEKAIADDWRAPQ
jgi:hypothetical protein